MNSSRNSSPSPGARRNFQPKAKWNRNAGFNRALVNEVRSSVKIVDKGLRTSCVRRHVVIEPDIIMNLLYAHTRITSGSKVRTNGSNSDVLAANQGLPVVGTLFGRSIATPTGSVLAIEDSFINSLENKNKDGTDQSSDDVDWVVRADYHMGMLDLCKGSSNQNQEIVGMIINTMDMAVVNRLQDWLVGQKSVSRWNPSKRGSIPIFICVDASLSSKRLDIRAYQRDRNGIMSLEVPVAIGNNFPRSVITAIHEDSDQEDSDNEEEVNRHLEISILRLKDMLQTLKNYIEETQDISCGREVFNALCVNPLIKTIISVDSCERMTGDAMSMVYLLRLAELQAEISVKLCASMGDKRDEVV